MAASHCGEGDIVKANGQWYFHGSLITREKMVKLFASVLINEDGHYYLKTPVEKMRITVENAHFNRNGIEKTTTLYVVII